MFHLSVSHYIYIRPLSLSELIHPCCTLLFYSVHRTVTLQPLLIAKMGEAVDDVYVTNGSNGWANHPMNGLEKCEWFEEEVDENLKLCYALNSVLHRGSSSHQDIALLDTKHFGKALVIDGKMQSTEMDEFIYHECLIHPALLFHPNPKTVFIMGGGEGSAAREVLKHKSIQCVVMCDIDQEVVDFCRRYLTANYNAFASDKLCLVINDAKAELEKRQEKYDVIIGDLSDPVEGGPCYQLYTKSFYENVVKSKLNYRGIFVTQAGPAGVFTHKEVFTSIHNTLKQVFKYVKTYTAHIPSFVDTWGWIMASDHPFSLNAEEIDQRITDRIKGELLYLNGHSLISATTMNKAVQESLAKETHVYTEDNARFIYGHGIG
ncbi:Polyamine aminopropyltransferase [Rhynchospora pubera]|uniref:thermospermine synthase n=1 Tax=Rhynchospora pubera TaxID=906938 RepID=A0AAV8G6E0_9POAL|nr:Polyamine aminopropyltransferase [Rhynchospora pubera]